MHAEISDPLPRVHSLGLFIPSAVNIAALDTLFLWCSHDNER